MQHRGRAWGGELDAKEVALFGGSTGATVGLRAALMWELGRSRGGGHGGAREIGEEHPKKTRGEGEKNETGVCMSWARPNL